MEDTSISAVVLVADNGTDDDESDDEYEALVYIHAGLMGLTFGILLPTGAFLASHKYFRVHMISQPIGIALAITGLVMVVAYVEVTSGKHFDKLIHGVVGLTILVLVFLVMPILLAKKQWRRWHRRTGHIVAFFGMGNVLLVSRLTPGCTRNFGLIVLTASSMHCMMKFYSHISHFRVWQSFQHHMQLP